MYKEKKEKLYIGDIIERELERLGLFDVSPYMKGKNTEKPKPPCETD